MGKIKMGALGMILFIIACQSPKKKEVPIEKWKNEIVATEKAFAEMAGKEGIPRAFLTFAAEDAVLMRNNIIIKGKDAIQENFLKQSGNWANAQLTWEPSYVDVAASGDLGYTYGSFMYTTKDSIGNLVSMEGVFHTVWKRQPDGAWRFVWD